ncbi:MAG: nicotinate-nucleotide adenylyltransferase [Pseudomonadota bacterium]
MSWTPSFRALKTEQLAPGMTVGLFGGSFDPVHAGHVHAAETAKRALGLDRVWWIVSPQNPLKSHAPGEYRHRLAAVRQAASAPGMVVSDVEARFGVNRTADLLEHLIGRHRRVKFVWIMGADSLGGFHRWARWREIVQAVPICVIARPGYAVAARFAKAARLYRHAFIPETRARALPFQPAPCWTYLTETFHAHASSAIRARAAC